MRYLAYFLLFYTSLAWSQQSPVEIPIQRIELKAFEEAIVGQNRQLIDVRTTKEYALGHIENARNIPIKRKRKFKQAVLTLDKEQAVYIYCYSGMRSSRASKLLRRLGFKKIIDFKGGWKAWSAR